jgi:hypothetical protein
MVIARHLHGAQLGNARVDEAKAKSANDIVPKQASSSAVGESVAEGEGNNFPRAEQG